jgi:hypothetical protein
MRDAKGSPEPRRNSARRSTNRSVGRNKDESRPVADSAARHRKSGEGTDDDSWWDVFLADDDEFDPLPAPGDFWIEPD